MKIGFMIIRNGIVLGYPFVEALASTHGCCDKFVIFDCGSSDGTLDVLDKIAKVNGKFEICQMSWPKKSASGSAIAIATNRALNDPRIASASKALYVQADEVYHQDAQRQLDLYMKKDRYRSVSFRFSHFRNSLLHVIQNPSYDRALRIITPKGTKSLLDGYNFGGKVNPINQSHVRVFHMGWCFPYNICRKHINHAVLYPGNPTYENAKKVCQQMLKTGKLSTKALNDKIDRHYNIIPFKKHKMPRYLDHLFGMSKYDAYYSLSVLLKEFK